MTRKEMKAQAKHRLKKHYLLFVVICLAAAILGTEFSHSITAVTTYEEIAGSTAVTTMAPGPATNPNLPQTQDGTDDNGVLGHTRGVFAYLLNMASSGTYVVMALNGISSVVQSDVLGFAILVLLAGIVMFLFWFLLVNPFSAVSRRMFLEGRLYDKVPPQRLTFFFRVKRWLRCASVMLLKTVFLALWALTIVGWVIKRYSYYMVPYIVAENPNIKAREAITLSRKMMDGHKWECFVFELSFIGWEILGFLTLGLSGILFSNPYKVAAMSEYYAVLRAQALASHPESAALLNDVYLFTTPDAQTLTAAYSDVVALINEPAEVIELHGFRGFLARNFGILLGFSAKEEAYEKYRADQVVLHSRKDALEGRTYPARLFTIPEKEKRPRVETMHYLRHYTIWSLLCMFFIFSFVGWVWEVSLHLIAEHEFVNRGVLHGPWLPIYGFGGILILVVLNRLRAHPGWEFACAVVLCGCVEYFTAYYLEMTHGGHKWWDYSGYFLNLHGRICAEGLLVFGLGGMAVVYLLAPMLDNYLRRVNTKILAPIALALLLVFACDEVYSSAHPNAGKGITDEVSAPESQAAIVKTSLITPYIKTEVHK